MTEASEGRQSGESFSTEHLEPSRFVDRFPRYWAFGTSGRFFCWRGSGVSQEAAQQAADKRAAELKQLFESTGQRPPRAYAYGDRQLREPLLEVVGESVVSRNLYGCAILNTPNVMFIDIDFPEFKKPGLLRRLFGKVTGPTTLEEHGRVEQEAALARIDVWTRTHPQWGWRAYRTFAGLRLIATHALFTPGSAEVRRIFEELGADPLYSKLCDVQMSFRARLTPKPWRCGHRAPPVRWPWGSAENEQAFAQWQSAYTLASRGYATCSFVGSIGTTDLHPGVAGVVRFHDQATGATVNAPLA